MLRCGTCGRRLESTWSSHRAAYRCRHGYTSAARPDPGRPKNLYLREDQALPRLAALATLLAGQGQARSHTRPKRGSTHVTAPAQSAELIGHLRVGGLTLTYDPQSKTLQTGTQDAITVTLA